MVLQPEYAIFIPELTLWSISIVRKSDHIDITVKCDLPVKHKYRNVIWRCVRGWIVIFVYDQPLNIPGLLRSVIRVLQVFTHDNSQIICGDFLKAMSSCED